MPRGRSVGLVFDDRYLTHNTGLDMIGDVSPWPFADPVPHVSSPALVGRAKHLMDLFGVSERMQRVDPALATDEQLTVYHAPAYLERVAHIAQSDGGDCGAGAPIGRGGDRVARLAAGGTIAVVAARQAQRIHGAERVLILDWDVHHGNGTQAAFWSDPSVLISSLHQDDLYPAGWGAVDQVGIGDGEGFTVNIPLPAGAGNRAYGEAITRIVAPISRQFDPDLVMVSAGQDASVFDPLARMSLTLAGYRAMTETMLAIADECCDGRLAVTQEGGYAAQYAPYCSATIAQTLVGLLPGEEPIPDPYGERAVKQPASNEVGLDADNAIGRAESVLRRCWSL